MQKERNKAFSKIMPSNSKEVQVFVPVQTSTTNDFTDVIKCIFKDLPVEWKLCDAYEELSKKIPLVVVCQISSRFEPDIDLAMTGIKREEEFVVIILNTGLKRSLPSLSTASKLANKEKYKNIEFIDIAFNVDDKFYQCEMNTTARDLLESFFDDKQQIKKRESIGVSNVLDESRQQANNDIDALSSTSTSEGAKCLDTLRTKGIDPQNQNHSGSKDENCQQTQYDGNAMTNNFTTKGSDIQNEDAQGFVVINNSCDVPTEQRNSTNEIGKCTGESISRIDSEEGIQEGALSNSKIERSKSSEHGNTTPVKGESTCNSNCLNEDQRQDKHQEHGFFSSLRSFIREKTPPKSKRIQVLVPVQTPTTKEFADEIKYIVKGISVNLCESYQQISKQSPLIVVCQLFSRFEPDIDLALTGIKHEGQFVVIILHTGFKRNLPLLSTAYKLANNEKYKNIEFIDIAFNRDDKFYDCPMNSKASDSLEFFCTNFYK